LTFQQEQLLASQLRACGHFLYYQTGGKAGQRRILLYLLRHENPTQRELQELLEISSGALSEILQKMEDAGLVERKKSCGDKRQVDLALTIAGRERALEAKEHYTLTLESMFTCFGDEEAERLSASLAKLVAHLEVLKADPQFMAGAACNGADM